jgi:hypothetical protein
MLQLVWLKSAPRGVRHTEGNCLSVRQLLVVAIFAIESLLI